MAKKRALLITYPDRFVLEEAYGLAEAADYTIVKTITQKYLLKAKYGIGIGKAEEIKSLVQDLDIDVILFDEKLRSVQIYNLAKLTGVEVIDRERLILEIFNKRASSSEAKLQVRLAELRYEMPRAREKVRLAKMGEQPGFLGLGKYDVDVYYRDIRRRFSTIKRKLRDVSKRRGLYRVQRQRLNIPTVSLAGYTGVGKTTLFNLLTGEEKEVAAGAFTTLSPSTRSITLFNSKILVSDTVGFISRLPTYMIEAFKSTLEELTYSNIVLLLIDISLPYEDMLIEYQSCLKVLTDLEVSPSKVLLVFNKFDTISLDDAKDKLHRLGVIEESYAVVSAKNGYGLDNLKNRIYELVFEPAEFQMLLKAEELIKESEGIEWLRENAQVSLAENSDGTLSITVKAPAWVVERYRHSRRGELRY